MAGLPLIHHEEHEKNERQPQEPMPAVKSAGEKWFDRIVYAGLNYWANLGVSLVIADYFTHLSGRAHLDRLIGATAKTLTKSGITSPGGAARSAKIIWETLTLSSGGWLAAFATKPLEDNKRPIVHWLNRRLHVNQSRPDGSEASPEEIYIENEQPHQTWLNVIRRRIMASALIIGAGHAIDHTVGTRTVTEGVVKGVNATLNALPVLHKLPRNATFERYLGFAALDTLFTAVHAVTMSLTSGAKKARMPKEMQDTAPPGAEVTPNEITLLPETPPAGSFSAALRDSSKARATHADRLVRGGSGLSVAS